nr:hypothetical protein [Tanacetum cinerariifolium]
MSSLFADTHNVVAILEKSDAAGEEELGAEHVQVDAVVAAAVVEDVAEDVAHVATPLPPPHGIPS